MKATFDIVVKCGGGLLAHPDVFDGVIGALKVASRRHSMLVVPGGGPFADAVRGLVHPLGLSDDVAHWMAIRSMDVHACLLAERLGATLVTRLHALPPECAVLAPYAWVREEDPLPHTWDVTSDSIAAWIAGRVQAPRLVLIKPPGATGRLVDEYFWRALPDGVSAVTVCADRIDELRESLNAP